MIFLATIFFSIDRLETGFGLINFLLRPISKGQIGGQ